MGQENCPCPVACRFCLRRGKRNGSALDGQVLARQMAAQLEEECPDSWLDTGWGGYVPGDDGVRAIWVFRVIGGGVDFRHPAFRVCGR